MVTKTETLWCPIPGFQFTSKHCLGSTVEARYSVVNAPSILHRTKVCEMEFGREVTTVRANIFSTFSHSGAQDPSKKDQQIENLTPIEYMKSALLSNSQTNENECRAFLQS